MRILDTPIHTHVSTVTVTPDSDSATAFSSENTEISPTDSAQVPAVAPGSTGTRNPGEELDGSREGVASDAVHGAEGNEDGQRARAKYEAIEWTAFLFLIPAFMAKDMSLRASICAQAMCGAFMRLDPTILLADRCLIAYHVWRVARQPRGVSHLRILCAVAIKLATRTAIDPVVNWGGHAAWHLLTLWETIRWV